MAQFLLNIKQNETKIFPTEVLVATGLISLDYIANHKGLAPGKFAQKVWDATPQDVRGNFPALQQTDLFRSLEEVFAHACEHARKGTAALVSRSSGEIKEEVHSQTSNHPRLNALILSNPKMKKSFSGEK